MKTKYYPIIILLLGLMAGCKVYYHNTYQTYLEGSPDESLIFKDSLITISFDPKPNGVLFDIQNHTKNNLYLIWDKSYFIEPDGSSSKLLNTDILETNKTIVEKENYESVIPQQGHFPRFTCPAKNLSVFSSLNTNTIYNKALNKITTYAAYSEFFLSGPYWVLYIS